MDTQALSIRPALKDGAANTKSPLKGANARGEAPSGALVLGVAHSFKGGRRETLFTLIGHRFSAYVALTKPTLQLLVVVTGAAGLVMEGSLLTQPWRFILVLAALALSAGSAKALNQYLERNVDAAMTRTRRRPIPEGTILPAEALVIAAVWGLAAVILFWYFFNPLSAILTAATILFYSVFYTLYLKPRTPYSIVIGGVAGGMGPVIAWAAATGSTGLAPWLMLAVIFFWTPPHFWSLAICYAEDYRRVGHPMLPTTKGAAATWQAIQLYTWGTVFSSFSLLLVGAGWVYGITALGLGVILLGVVYRAKNKEGDTWAQSVFIFSIIYLLALFAALILDGSLGMKLEI